MTLFFIASAAFFATICGGLFALKLSDKLHLILGFSAGAVLGVAFFDLMPEAIELGQKFHDPSTLFAIMALGFASYLVMDRLVFLHGHTHETDDDHKHHSHAKEAVRGSFGASTLSFHSLLDGLAVGFAFQVSPAVGVVVASAVLAHDFSDGINTVSFIMKNGGSRRTALTWLLVDAAAPVVGIFATMFVTVSESDLSLLLSLFAGFFLYIGASDLLPESHHAHPKAWTTISSLIGIAALYGIIRLAGM